MRCAAGRKINRYYGRQISVGINKTEMHVFTDASGQAYSAVCYFQAWRDEDDKYEVILGKTHVSYPNRQFKHVFREYLRVAAQIYQVPPTSAVPPPLVREWNLLFC